MEIKDFEQQQQLLFCQFGKHTKIVVSLGDVEGCAHNISVWANNPEIPRCPQNNWLALILVAVYLMFVNILLLNLLIAMFR